VILTARIDDIRDATIGWLTTNNIRHDWLILRGPRQGAPSTEWKAGQLELLRAAGAEIQLCADDDPRNVEMMRGPWDPDALHPVGLLRRPRFGVRRVPMSKAPSWRPRIDQPSAVASLER
jgi:hypothetical protein